MRFSRLTAALAMMLAAGFASPSSASTPGAAMSEGLSLCATVFASRQPPPQGFWQKRQLHRDATSASMRGWTVPGLSDELRAAGWGRGPVDRGTTLYAKAEDWGQILVLFFGSTCRIALIASKATGVDPEPVLDATRSWARTANPAARIFETPVMVEGKPLGGRIETGWITRDGLFGVFFKVSHNQTSSDVLVDLTYLSFLPRS